MLPPGVQASSSCLVTTELGRSGPTSSKETKHADLLPLPAFLVFSGPDGSLAGPMETLPVSQRLWTAPEVQDLGILKAGPPGGGVALGFQRRWGSRQVGAGGFGRAGSALPRGAQGGLCGPPRPVPTGPGRAGWSFFSSAPSPCQRAVFCFHCFVKFCSQLRTLVN